MKKPLIPQKVINQFKQFISFLKNNKYLILFPIPFAIALVVFFIADGMLFAAIATFILSFIVLYFWNFTKNLLGGIFATVGTLGLMVFLFGLVIYLILRSTGGDVYEQFNVFEIMDAILNR